jgi:hypothetical protein
MHAMVGQPEHAETFAVYIPNLPPVQPAEETLSRRERGEVLLEVGPCPLGHSDDSIARVGFRAARPNLAAYDVDVRLNARECSRDLNASTVLATAGQRHTGEAYAA